VRSAALDEPAAVPVEAEDGRTALGGAALRLLSVAIVLGLWEVAGRGGVNPALPAFSETALAALAMLADGSLPAAFLVTLEPLVLGLAISTLLGVGLGVAMGLWRPAEWLGVPVLVILQAAPLAALVPLLTFAYGIGLTSKTLVVCIMALPVIVLNAYRAIRHTPQSLVEMGRVFLASPRIIVLRIVLPAASPVIFAGLRLGVAAGFIGAILAELLITPTGIGDLVTYHQSVADYPRMYAAIAAIVLASALTIGLLERVEIRLFRPERAGR
jgi:NitT/TauT family transport system permease protein